MSIDLFGDTFINGHEYARKVVTKSYSLPFYKIQVKKYRSSGQLFENRYDIRYYNGRERVSLNESGLYAIYRKIGNKMEPLYNGSSDYSMSSRIYRFIKELDDASREDETHPGAKKAKRDGIKSSDELYVKVLFKRDFPSENDIRFPLVELDEYIAPLIKSKYNVRIRR